MPLVQAIFVFVLWLAQNAHGQQSCTCDLITGACEVNCCCDADCDPADIASFSTTCVENQFNVAIQICVSNQVVMNNNPNVVAESRQDDLYCIVEDTFSERNFYTNPSCILRNTCFDNLDSFIQPVPPFSGISLGEIYRAGDAIVVEYTSGAQSFLSTPAAGASALCEDYNPIQFLFPRRDSCSRQITSFSCGPNLVLDYTSYVNFTVFSTPNNTNSSIISTPNNTNSSNTVTITANCTKSNAPTACESAQFGNSTCINAVAEVSYTILTNGTSGIDSLEISIVLIDVADEGLPFTQTFSVSFRTVDNNAFNVTPQVRSGNPGYLVGRPVLAAQVATGSATSNNDIFLVRPDATGMCSNFRQPLLFRQDQRTGCRVAINSTDCSALQGQINKILSDVIFNTSNMLPYIAMFGNVNISSFAISEWLPVTQGATSASPVLNSTGCDGMVLGARYDISFADTGTVTSPQPQIVAVRHSYAESEFLPFICPPGTCNQSVEVSTSVDFVDVSETLLSQQRSIPTIEEKFPINFLFPLKNINFNYNSSVKTEGNFILLLFLTALSFFFESMK